MRWLRFLLISPRKQCRFAPAKSRERSLEENASLGAAAEQPPTVGHLVAMQGRAEEYGQYWGHHVIGHSACVFWSFLPLMNVTDLVVLR